MIYYSRRQHSLGSNPVEIIATFSKSLLFKNISLSKMQKEFTATNMQNEPTSTNTISLTTLLCVKPGAMNYVPTSTMNIIPTSNSSANLEIIL